MSVVMRARIGADGVVSVRVPPTVAQQGADVQITIELLGEADVAKTPQPPVVKAKRHFRDQAEWQEFLQSEVGVIDDTAFKRYPQGDYERRESLD